MRHAPLNTRMRKNDESCHVGDNTFEPHDVKLRILSRLYVRLEVFLNVNHAVFYCSSHKNNVSQNVTFNGGYDNSYTLTDTFIEIYCYFRPLGLWYRVIHVYIHSRPDQWQILRFASYFRHTCKPWTLVDRKCSFTVTPHARPCISNDR